MFLCAAKQNNLRAGTVLDITTITRVPLFKISCKGKKVSVIPPENVMLAFVPFSLSWNTLNVSM